MNTSQTSMSNDNHLKLYLNERDISFLLKVVEKSKDIFLVGQEKLGKIYSNIDYACKYNIGFDPVETFKEIKKIGNVITKHENIEEEVSE